MSKWLRFCRKGLVFGVACGLAMIASGGREARAGIVMELSLDGGATFINMQIFVTPLLSDPGQLQNYGTVDLDALNTALGVAGSAYSFSALGGSSNWAGTPNGGALAMSGGIEIKEGVTGNNSLIIREHEDGFTSPSGPAGALKSASTGDFIGAEKGNQHSAQSAFNAITTPTYLVQSSGQDPNHQGGDGLAAIPAFVTPYTLTNQISFGLIPSAGFTPTDSFGLVAGATIVPEPASVIAMMIGLPVPLLGLAWLRRRRAMARA